MNLLAFLIVWPCISTITVEGINAAMRTEREGLCSLLLSHAQSIIFFLLNAYDHFERESRESWERERREREKEKRQSVMLADQRQP